eukprot:jgi/Mesvir1/16947/Mv15798-RA.1
MRATAVRKSASRTSTIVRCADDTGLDAPDWYARNESLVRALPLIVGAVGGVAAVANRTLLGTMGMPAVTDASNALSRADLLCFGTAATLILTGLQWVSFRPRDPVPVELDGVQSFVVDETLPTVVQEELRWVWRALSSASRCKSLFVFHRDRRLMQAGLVARAGGGADARQLAMDVTGAMQGPICASVKEAGRGTYMANLILYPGRVEFVYVPGNTQAIIVQPIGKDGVIVAVSDTVRGFTPLDQGWISEISDKLDASLGEAS